MSKYPAEANADADDDDDVDKESQEMKKLPYPKAVLLIIATEFCERFSFVGMKGETSK